VLRTWGQRTLASNLSAAARELLATDIDRSAIDEALLGNDPTTETGSVTLAALKRKKRGKTATSQPSGKDEMTFAGNEELKALEAHMLKLSKQGMK
jgi:hypothetical protein